MSLHSKIKSNKRIWVLMLVVVSVFCAILFVSKGRFMPTVFPQAVITVLAPFQRAVAWASFQGENIYTFCNDILTVYEENQALKEQVIQLTQENTSAKEDHAENERLRALLDYKSKATQFDLLAASVIGRELDTWTNTVIINRGSMDAVQKNMPVVTEKGPVGKVVEVTPNAAKSS